MSDERETRYGTAMIEHRSERVIIRAVVGDMALVERMELPHVRSGDGWIPCWVWVPSLLVSDDEEAA